MGVSPAPERRRPPARRRQGARRLPPWAWLLVAVGVLTLAGVAFTRGGGGESRTQRAEAAPVANLHTDMRDELGPRDKELVRLARKGGSVLAGGGTRPVVALTFDDGPDEYTDRIVDELDRLHVPATFFVLGKMVGEHPEALAHVVASGHEVAIHSWDHPDLRTLSADRVRAQIVDTEKAVTEATGTAPRLFRPPYGAVDAAVLGRIQAARLVTVLWDVDTNDWQRPGPEAIAQTAVQNAKPGSIILMHDGGGDRSQTLAALPLIVKGLRARGFDFGTVGDLLVSDPPRTGNVTSVQDYAN